MGRQSADMPPAAAAATVATEKITRATGGLGRSAQIAYGVLAAASLLTLAVAMSARNPFWWLNASWTSSGAFAMIAAWHATRHSAGAWRRMWWMLAVANAAWVFGEAVWIYYGQTAYPSSPNIADFSWYLFGAIGVVAMYQVLAASRGRRWSRWTETALLIVAVGAGATATLFETADASTLSFSAKAAAIAYPVVFVSVPVVLAQAMLSSPRTVRTRIDVLTLFAGMLVEAVAFIIWAPQILKLTYVPGDSPADVLWTLGMVMIGLSAILARSGDLPKAPPGDLPESTRGILPSAAFLGLLAALMFAEIADAPETVDMILVLGLTPVSLILVGNLISTVRSQGALIVKERAARADMSSARAITERFFNISRDLMVMIGANRELVRINPAWTRILGLDSDAVTDKRLIDFVHPDDVERTEEAVSKLFEGEAMSGFSNRFHASDGTWRWLTWQAVYDPEEQLVFASASDTTETRRISRLLADLNDQLEKRAVELEHSNTDLQQFASIASHELREPLRTVSGFAHLIERRYAGQLDERADSYIEFIVQGVDRMNSLIEALLRYSRVGQSAAQPVEVDTDALVGEVISDMQSVIWSSNAQVTVGPLPAIEADPHLIAWVFQNLIANGIKYCKEPSPQVTIEGAVVGDGWEFIVTDNGIGIEPQHADRIFTIFQRLYSRDEYGGTGIGLAVTRRAVELHGGAIRVEPADGGGSKFIFTIPCPANTNGGGAK